jgi:hypothetical protein
MWQVAARVCVNTTLSPAASVLACVALEKRLVSELVSSRA